MRATPAILFDLDGTLVDTEANHYAAWRALVRLAATIDAVEALGRVPDSARLRIVLAEMSGDPSPLDLARPVLERLEDRQFLRRLEEVAASLR